MEDLNIRNLIYLVVVGIGAGIYLKFIAGHTGKKLVAKLEQLGLKKVEGVESGGSKFQGVFKDLAAGYAQGAAADFTIESQTSHGEFVGGAELWIGDGLGDVPLAIVERKDAAWQKYLPPGVVPKGEVSIGHQQFDERFELRCDNSEWAKRVVTTELADKMVSAGPCLFVLCEGRVYAPSFFDNKTAIRLYKEDRKQSYSRYDTVMDLIHGLALNIKSNA